MLYENYGTHDNAFLRVFVHEPSGRASVGARVTLHRTDGSMEMREIISTSNFLGQSEYVAHFGLGNAAPAELAHIDVLWPHTGQTMRVTGASLLMTSPGKTGGAMLKVTRPKSDPRTEVTAESVLLDLPVSRRKGFDKVMAHARSTQDKQLAADASEVAALDAAAKSARADLPPALRELFDTIVSKGAPAKPRSLSGDGNNAENKAWGKAGAPLIRKTPPGYDDGISSPAGPFRPSARLVSNEIFDQKHSIESERRLNDMYVTSVMTFVLFASVSVRASPWILSPPHLLLLQVQSLWPAPRARHGTHDATAQHAPLGKHCYKGAQRGPSF